jgi:hypothetical protein
MKLPSLKERQQRLPALHTPLLNQEDGEQKHAGGDDPRDCHEAADRADRRGDREDGDPGDE